MQIKCERAVSEIFPVARALIAKGLIDSYGFSQTKAAKLMGLSQPAVSQYKKDIRGKRGVPFADQTEFIAIANDIAERLADGSIKANQMGKEMCRFCRLLEL